MGCAFHALQLKILNARNNQQPFPNGEPMIAAAIIFVIFLVGCCRAFYAWGYNKGRIDEMKGEPRA